MNIGAYPERPLRVTILGVHYRPESTGNAPYTSALAEGLVRLGHDVRVVTAHPHYPELIVREGYGSWTSRELINGVRVTRVRHSIPRKASNAGRVLSEVTFGIRLLAAQWGRPDVVLLVSPALISTSLATARARLLGRNVAIVVWVQDLYSLGVTETGAGGGTAARVMTWIESKTLRAASGVVAIHARFATYLTDVLGVDADRIEIIRNWTHLDAPGEPDVPAMRSRHGWQADETIVLHAGNMGAKQGLDNVVRAARLADERRLPLRFVLLGDGNQRAALQRMSTGVHRIQFIDPLEDQDFQATLVAANILLVNEKVGVSEMSVPSKLTSYFTTGNPVLASTDPAGVTASEIAASKAGLIVPSGDPAALVDAVQALRGDPNMSRELGANGVRYRRKSLDQDAAIGLYARLLAEIASRAGT